MGKIAAHEFISLDGVFEDPSWAFRFAAAAGQRLFGDHGEPVELSLAATDVYANGAVHLAYRLAD